MDQSLNKAFTSSRSEVSQLEVELRQNGIESRVRERNGINGMRKLNGSNHALTDLFIDETDISKAGPVILKFLSEQE